MASSKFCSVLSLVLFLVLLTHANSACDTSFNFHSFNETNLILQGQATVSSNGKLKLNTYDSMCSAFYSAPIQIRDSTTGKVASFDTNFTMNITTNYYKNSAIGLDFALVPVQPKSKGHFKTPDYDRNAGTVTVEFDTFRKCISIDSNHNDLNSVPWNVLDYDRQNTEVRITYNSSTKVLAVSLLNPITGKSNKVSARMELEKILDDWVSVGFSATSGAYQWGFETNEVLSWSFSSKFSQHTTSERSNIVLDKIRSCRLPKPASL
uniref:Alpha-amylase inhibitor AI-Pa2 n=1 Tax=Phaseolus acutifolius TaxID=33129 RepID=Q4H4H3_PHAAT|nr:alpha-amylase inhibitor AI-Pa2 [Phaseolus acutifolius]